MYIYDEQAFFKLNRCINTEELHKKIPLHIFMYKGQYLKEVNMSLSILCQLRRHVI